MNRYFNAMFYKSIFLLLLATSNLYYLRMLCFQAQVTNCLIVAEFRALIFYRYYVSVIVMLIVMVFAIQRSADQFSICTVLFIRPQGKFSSGTVFCFQQWQKEMVLRESTQLELLYTLGKQNCCIMFYQGIQS